jgi:hypothetical protein
MSKGLKFRVSRKEVWLRMYRMWESGFGLRVESFEFNFTKSSH